VDPVPQPVASTEAPETTDATPEPPLPKPDCSPELVRLQSIEDVRAFVERAHCNGHAFDGTTTPLMRAAKEGRSDVVTYLIASGANVNFELPGPGRDVGIAEYGRTALWYAVLENRLDVVRLLLAAGANPNLFPPEGVPLLLLAQGTDNIDIARELLKAGSDPKQATKDGTTVMTFADGPSAAMFGYLTQAGLAPTGLSPEVADSLRWELAHQPPANSSNEQQVAFAIEVIRTTRSARSREAAIKRIPKFGGAATTAVPILVKLLVHGPELTRTDWSRVAAANTLMALGWGPELDAALSSLLAGLNGMPTQVRIGTIRLIATQAPPSERVFSALLAQLSKGPDRGWGARGLGLLLARPIKIDARWRRKILKALERAAQSQDIDLKQSAQWALDQIKKTPVDAPR
jgi:hypothetical protein